jgi:alpha-methylacyl-CoA racemase
MTGPLAGIKIVEIDAIGPVPLAATLLADMGADIIRVARPPYAGAAWDDVGGAVIYRSRDVVYLNLKDAADRDQLLQLIDGADGLIEGYRPGVMERLGLGPDICLARNPRLVFGRMTGWGQSGPMAFRAGHDINYISISGALHAIGEKGRPPVVPLNLVGDYGGGAMFLITGLLAALLSARTTGRGQVVDACMTDGVASLMSLFHAFKSTGAWIDEPASNLLDGGAPFYRCYACSGGGHVAVGCLEPQFFARMVEGLGLQHRDYVQNDQLSWPAMQADFEQAFRERTRDEWAAHFVDSDACVTPVLSLTEAPTHPHNVARETYVDRGGFPQPAPAPRFTDTPAAIGESVEVSIGQALARWSL